MAKVILAGLEVLDASRLARYLIAEGHEVRRENHNVPMRDLLSADIIFAGGRGDEYLSLLRRVRVIDSVLPFVIVARLPWTGVWLDALGAGVTDFCEAPLRFKQVQWLMELVLSGIRTAVA